MKVWSYTESSKVVGDPAYLKVFETIEAARAWFEHNDPNGVALEYETVVAQFYNRLSKAQMVFVAHALGAGRRTAVHLADARLAAQPRRG